MTKALLEKVRALFYVSGKVCQEATNNFDTAFMKKIRLSRFGRE